MNTIPSIFNENHISYSVFGGSEVPTKVLIPVTCIVMSRNGRQYRSMVLDNLVQKGFEKIISVNPQSEQNVIVGLSQRYPTVKFLVAQENASVGELINLGFKTAETEHVLLVQEEMCAEKINFTPSIAERLSKLNQFCVVPRLISSSIQRIPVVFAPSAKKSVFTVDTDISISDGQKTLYSFDYAGFYSREKFIELGGFDYSIESRYWQKMDIYLRAWLWGEKITVANCFEFTYADAFPEDDSTVDISYLRFFLKNIIPVFVKDHAVIMKKSFLSFKARSSCGLVEAWKQFKDAINWTRLNQYRFKTDALSLIENWEKKNED